MDGHRRLGPVRLRLARCTTVVERLAKRLPECSAAIGPQPADQKAAVDEFFQLVREMAGRNAENRLWWYAWVSCYDRLNTQLSDQIGELVLFRRALAEEPGKLTFEVRSPLLIHAFAAAARATGRPIHMDLRDRMGVYWHRLSTPLCRLADIARGVRYGLRWWWTARRYPLPPLPSDLDVIFCSVFDAHMATNQDGWLRDRYFGPLPRMLTERGERVASLGFAFDRDYHTAARCQQVKNPGVATFGHLIGLMDIAQAAATALCAPLAPTDHPLSSAGLEGSACDAVRGVLMERAIGRLLDAHPRARIIHTYENNGWERATAQAAKNRHDRREVIGFLHCALVPAHLKFYRHADEQRPGPDRIICTGPGARALFLGQGAHDPARVVSACDLRGALPPPGPVRPRRPRIGTVLVILEGYWTAPLLAAAHNCAWRADRTVVVRAHPVVPAADVAAIAGVPLGTKVQVSTESDLLADLERADLVVYCGSTVSLTALALGIPLVHFDRCLSVTDDPLVLCPALKRSARIPADLEGACRAFEDLDADAYAAEATAGQRYAREYFLAPDAERIRPFLAGFNHAETR